MSKYYIGADVHCNNTELAVEEKHQIMARYSVPTTIPAISQVLESLQGTKQLAFEEGPMAGWLYRHLHMKVDQLIVAEPRRNKLITSGGDKDDKIDAAKLAALLRGKFLKPVHHTDDSDRAHFKHWVNLYHARIREATRNINTIRACCRVHGIAIPRKVIRNQKHRELWISKLNNPVLVEQLNMLWIGYDATRTQVAMALRQLNILARHYSIIKLWGQLAGVGLIRAATIFAYLDTPWRFKKRSKLYKYCGVGLERTSSGKDKNGNFRPPRLRLPFLVNGRLKDAVLGAATTAIYQQSNVFKDYYERMVSHGISSSNAKHSVARKMISVMSAMWKTSSAFDPTLV
jgi:hypothetical protein